ncbi:related to conserved oligomeric golgi complex component 4 [Cephalotrichum gorgonifer]|uniref:Conserved oligomeric Golgi complex subunit 4 n=1 Tax=Cephalotrichum gorgonifer TaxID=2041049 RepID=A0AAE8MP09_9PEZI|nr:related to conserved oligomeric golgi complex component 4 [Cephalotrichum gorgonifer]
MSPVPTISPPHHAATAPSHKSDLKSSSSAAQAPRPNIRDATTPSEIRAALASLHQRESSITDRLDALLSSQADLNRELSRLDILRAGLGSQVVATRTIGREMLAGAAETAGRLSDKVKELDLEKGRVEDTLGVVEQVAELKACVSGVVGSMGAPQDWEAAAGYLARAGRIPDEIVRGRFAAEVVPTVEVPDPPWVTLEGARESLCSLFLREFEKAASEGDGAKVTRFFKLFPLIARGDVGLDVYGKYVCQGVAGTARATLKKAPPGKKEGYFYANALTKLFEHIAQIVEGHGSLVEMHYGAGKMIRVVERLQAEADIQGGIIIDTWSDDRNVERRMTDVKSYPFSFLVQSFLPPQRGGASRVNSPATGGTSSNSRQSEDEGVDMKEIEGILSEIAIMLGRWSLYTRFIAGKCKQPHEEERDTILLPDVIAKSNLSRKVSTKLLTPYDVMTTFFFRRSVEKAFQLDEYPSGLSLSPNKPISASSPYIILAVDDVIFIVNEVIQKSLSTSQRDIISSITPAISRVLGSDFVGMIQRKMRDESYPKALVQGGFPPEDKVICFIVLINSLDMANEYLGRIIQTNLRISPDQPSNLPPNSPLREAFPNDRDAVLVATSLANLLNSFVLKTTELLNEGLKVLFQNVVRLRLRPVLSDTFRDVDYSLTEEELADAAQQLDQDPEVLDDATARRFEHGWDQLMRPIQRLMTPKTYGALLDLTAKDLARWLEKRVWSHAGRASPFGAVRMERDFSGVVGAVSKGNYATREVFGKVMQMLMVVNMEEEEWEEVSGPGADAGGDEDGILWVLTEEERVKARTLVKG